MNPRQAEYEIQAQEDVELLMGWVEAGNTERSREVISTVAADDAGVRRMAWMIHRLAGLLASQEKLAHDLSVAMKITRGLKPAGITKAAAARVALLADEKREQEAR